MVKYCTKTETTIKLNFTIIKLMFKVVVKVTRKWKEKIGLNKFFSIYLGWISLFYFCKIIFFITDNAPLIIQIFNNITDIILFLIRKLLFFLCAFIYNVIFEQHLSPQLSFIVLFRSLPCQSWMVITTLVQIVSREYRPQKSDWNCLNI